MVESSAAAGGETRFCCQDMRVPEEGKGMRLLPFLTCLSTSNPPIYVAKILHIPGTKSAGKDDVTLANKKLNESFCLKKHLRNRIWV